MSHKRGSKTITGEDELEVDIINILGDEGLEIKDYGGTNGDVLQKSQVTNELTWDVVPPPPDNSITSTMFVENAVNNRALGTDAVETINIKDSNITEDKIANNAVTALKIPIQTINNTHIAASTILSGNLADDSVTRLKIGDGEIHNENIADNSIAGSKIGDREITGNKIGIGQILEDNITTAAVTNSKLGALSVDSNKLANGAVTLDKIAAGAIEGSNLTAGFSIDSFGDIRLENPSVAGQEVFTVNKSVAGKNAGLGSVAIGPTQQIGLVIADPPTQGTALKGLLYCNAQEVIIPANAGTGWLPFQVKTAAGAAGDKFSIDVDGNVISALQIKANNFAVTGDNFTCNQSGDIVANSLDLDTGNINNLDELNFKDGHNGTTIKGSTNKTTTTNLKFDSSTNTFNRIDFDSNDFSTTITGCNYPTSETVATYLDLSSSTNVFDGKFYGLPQRIYYDTLLQKYYYSFNGADFRPNDDSTFYGISIVDSSSTFRGFAKSTHSSMEMVSQFMIPDGWTVTKVKVNNYSSALNLNCYKTYNDGTTSSTDLFADPADGAGSTRQTNTEQTLATNFTANRNNSIMLVIHTTSNFQYVAGGYLEVYYSGLSSGG